MERLSSMLPHRPLAAFRPKRGPMRDVLGVTERGDLPLVYAKSHIPELLSTTGAGEGSRAQIRASLNETRRYLSGLCQ